MASPCPSADVDQARPLSQPLSPQVFDPQPASQEVHGDWGDAWLRTRHATVRAGCCGRDLRAFPPCRFSPRGLLAEAEETRCSP